MKLSGDRLPIPLVEKTILRGLAILLCALSIILFVNEFIRINQIRTSVESGVWSVIISYTLLWRKGRIAIALIVNLIAMWSLKPKNFLLSAVPLVWVIIEYIYWFNISLQNKVYSGENGLPEPNTLGFYPATWLDIAVLSLALVLFAWSIKILIPIFRSLQDKSRTD